MKTTIRIWQATTWCDWRALEDLERRFFATEALARAAAREALMLLVEADAAPLRFDGDSKTEWPACPSHDKPQGVGPYTNPSRWLDPRNLRVEDGDDSVDIVADVGVVYGYAWKERVSTTVDGVTCHGEKLHRVEVSDWLPVHERKRYAIMGWEKVPATTRMPVYITPREFAVEHGDNFDPSALVVGGAA